MSQYEFIDFKRTGPRADLTLKRPPRNVLNYEMIEEIVAVLEPLRDDDTLKVLIISGGGINFCGGIEAEELAVDRVGLMMPSYTRIYDLLNDVRGVIIAAVRGEAFGAGAELAAFSDVNFAARGAKFCFPDMRMGLFPPIAAAILPRLVGRHRTFDWIFSGRVISADEAIQNDLISRILPDEQLDSFVEEYASKIASLSRPAVICAKRAIDAALYSPVMEALKRTESTYMIDLMNHADPHEGIKAAIEGRAPVWRNR